MLKLDDFQPITLEDKPLFDKHYEKYPPFHSDNVFTTLISWMDYADYHFTFKEKNLIIYSNIENIIRFRPPSGILKKDLFDEHFELSKQVSIFGSRSRKLNFNIAEIMKKSSWKNFITKSKIQKYFFTINKNVYAIIFNRHMILISDFINSEYSPVSGISNT